MDTEVDAVNALLKIIKDSLTGSDNESFDNGRIICALSFNIYYLLAFYNTFLGHGWSAVEFASGATAMAVGFGINLHLTKQPPEKKDES